MQKKPARDEFRSEKNGLEVVHVPTGARYWSYALANQSDRSVVAKQDGNLDRTLPNGDKYNAEEVQSMAQRVLRGE